MNNKWDMDLIGEEEYTRRALIAEQELNEKGYLYSDRAMEIIFGDLWGKDLGFLPRQSYSV